MQVGINQVKNGLTIELDGAVYYVVNCEPVKPGKGSAFLRTKLKNIKFGTIIDRTFRSNEKIEVAYIEKKALQYLYSSKGLYEFMDHDTFEQMALHPSQIGDMADCLKENLEVTAILYKSEILALEFPIFIDMRIVSTEPGIKGNTARSGTKPAKLESGMNVQVPLFINEGDIVRIDTRTKGYVGRA